MTPLPVAVLISGGGTTLRNLLDKVRGGTLPIDIRLVISSSSTARGLDFAREAGIPHVVGEKRRGMSDEAYCEAIFEPCRAAGIELVVMGGFLKHVLIPADFENRVVNIHPSLIPAFCGRGMYGLKVHEAALASGVKVTGCTVHFVDNQYDHGPIILQRPVKVLDEDTPETLQARVFAAECLAYPDALSSIAVGRVKVTGRRVQVGG
jgi:phosphoribosylglycinamide formyltransferase-1